MSCTRHIVSLTQNPQTKVTYPTLFMISLCSPLSSHSLLFHSLYTPSSYLNSSLTLSLLMTTSSSNLFFVRRRSPFFQEFYDYLYLYMYGPSTHIIVANTLYDRTSMNLIFRSAPHPFHVSKMGSLVLNTCVIQHMLIDHIFSSHSIKFRVSHS